MTFKTARRFRGGRKRPHPQAFPTRLTKTLPKISAKRFSQDLFMLTKTMTPEAIEKYLRVNKLLPRTGSSKETVKRWLTRRRIPFKEEKDRIVVGKADLWFIDGKYDGWGVAKAPPFGALIGKFSKE